MVDFVQNVGTITHQSNKLNMATLEYRRARSRRMKILTHKRNMKKRVEPGFLNKLNSVVH